MKCSFHQLETNNLGFVISEEGVKADKKFEAIRSLPVPTCVREVRSFMYVCVPITVDSYQTLVKLLNQSLC